MGVVLFLVNTMNGPETWQVNDSIYLIDKSDTRHLPISESSKDNQNLSYYDDV